MIVEIIVAAVILLICHILFIYIRDIIDMKRAGIPYSPGYPMIGRLLWMFSALRSDDIDLYTRAIQENESKDGGLGLVAFKRFWLGPMSVLTIQPSHVNHILKDNFKNYVKGTRFLECMEPMLGDGIFNANGAHWIDQRKTASHLFKVSELKSMIDVFVQHTPPLCSVIDDSIKSGNEIEMQTLFNAYTLDCFAEIAYGIKMGSLGSEGVSPFCDAFNVAQRSVLDRFIMYPLWKLPYFNNSKRERQLREAVAAMDEVAYAVIKARKSDESVADRKDLLSRYVMMQRGAPGKISDKYIRDILINFILAGRDTTAQGLLWTVYSLSLPENVEVLNKAREEVRGVDVEYASLKSSLPYLTHICYETLRMYPPVPADPKSAVADDVLPGGYKIKAGTTVTWSQSWMGRSSRHFEDPERYWPERWDKEDSPKLGTPPFIPFQAGPRVCLGQVQALLEMKAVLITLLQNYNWSLAPGQKILRFPNVTITAKYGIKIIFEKRQI